MSQLHNKVQLGTILVTGKRTVTLVTWTISNYRSNTKQNSFS